MTRLWDPARPLLIDAYSGAGGAAMGYWRAGFAVLGIDNRPQPRYPFPFVQADALEALASWDLRRVAAIHASPPCPARCAARVRGREYPRLIGPTRKLLEASGRPWVIENVPPAGPQVEYLRPDIILCACMFGLRDLKRSRHFEAGGWEWATDLMMRPPCTCREAVSVNRRGGRINRGPLKNRYVDLATCAGLMGIDWMTQQELGNAIPPVYTEAIGKALIKQGLM